MGIKTLKTAEKILKRLKKIRGPMISQGALGIIGYFIEEEDYKSFVNYISEICEKDEDKEGIHTYNPS